jgi:hypothetical protein
MSIAVAPYPASYQTIIQSCSRSLSYPVAVRQHWPLVSAHRTQRSHKIVGLQGTSRAHFSSERFTLLLFCCATPVWQTLPGAVVAVHGWLWSPSIRNSGSPRLNVDPSRLAWSLLSIEPQSIARIFLDPLLASSTNSNFPAVKIFTCLTACSCRIIM